MKCSVVSCERIAKEFYTFGDSEFGYCKAHRKIPEKQIEIIERNNLFKKKKRIRNDKAKRLLRSECKNQVLSSD